MTISTSIPKVTISPKSVSIDLAKTSTAKVSYSYKNVDKFDISLEAQGGFATFEPGEEKTNNKNVRSGSLIITATGGGVATLTIVARRNGQTTPIAATTIQVKVIAAPASADTDQTDAAAKVADAANKASKESSSSGSGSGSSTGGSAPVAPGGNGTKTTTPLTPEQKKKQQSDQFNTANKAFLERATGVGVDRQIYALREVTKNGKTTYQYRVGYCTTDCYVTLYNRYISYIDPAVNKPIVNIDHMLQKIMQKKRDGSPNKDGITFASNLIWFYKPSGAKDGTSVEVVSEVSKQPKETKKEKGYVIKGNTQPSNYLYNHKGHKIVVSSEITFTEKTPLTAEKLANLLVEHPSGLLLQQNKNPQHAICVIGYKYLGNDKYEFTIADPAGVAGKRSTDDERTYTMVLPNEYEHTDKEDNKTILKNVISKTYNFASTTNINMRLDKINSIRYLEEIE